MPQFQLDTSGAVAIEGRRAEPRPSEFTAWEHLDAFTQGYIEALFFTEEESLCEESDGTRHMPDVAVNTATMESHFVGGDSFGFSDLAPETLARIIADCVAFQDANDDPLWEAPQLIVAYDMQGAGRDFWYSRNGHGVGFWDRGLGSIGDILDAAAKVAGSVDVYLGDDGKVYLS